MTTNIGTTKSVCKNKTKKSNNGKEKTVSSIKGPGEYVKIDEKYNEIIKISTNFELYCPEIESNLKSYKNILAHATNAYIINKHLYKEIEDSDVSRYLI